MNNMRLMTAFLLIASTLAMSACNRPVPPEPSVPAAASPSGSIGATPTAAQQPHNPYLWLEPASLSACGAGKDVVTVNWDVTGKPEVKDVKIFIVEKNGPEGLFALTGSKGSKPTGEWMGAGKELVMRSVPDNREIARVTVGSTPCQ